MNRARNKDWGKGVGEMMGEDSEHKRRPVETKKRKEKCCGANDKKMRKETEETKGPQAETLWSCPTMATWVFR